MSICKNTGREKTIKHPEERDILLYGRHRFLFEERRIRAQIKNIQTVGGDVLCRGRHIGKRGYINVFLQPGFPAGKSTWDNCAKVLSMKTNAELEPYMIELMEWIQDMNWPGAFCILERLKAMQTEQLFEHDYRICMKCARALGDEVWMNNLKMIKKK